MKWLCALKLISLILPLPRWKFKYDNVVSDNVLISIFYYNVLLLLQALKNMDQAEE